MDNGNGASMRISRCLVERERRKHMKCLFTKLSSLLPIQQTKMSVPEMVDQATAYVKELQGRLEQHKGTKVQLERTCEMRKRKRMIRPVLNVRDLGYNLEMNLITGLNVEFALSDFINILQEEGADILSATCHHAGDKAIYTILCQAIYPRIGIETSSVHERLKSLIC
ncbi:hypothetical protein ES332_D04G219800v1 [Gossypium tomentosum]|uniref:BHLH domain-containing protein n=1 Tax=Gossypium tomentosum TaxID=34277 RepID=A0A5D2LG03_GOSTO|nr:hypothetical protein ES332_D04G219800v1 [Gossypium tomentosum]